MPDEESKAAGFDESQEDQEFSVLKQGDVSRQNVLRGKVRIYQKTELQQLIVQQIKTIIFRFEMILYLDQTQTITRIKIYELLTTLIRLDNQSIDEELAQQSNIIQCVVNDIEKFDSNSNVLSVLFELVNEITFQSTVPMLTTNLYEEFNLLQVLTKRISLSEYAKKPNERKDIYAYIHKLVHTLYQAS